MCVCVCTILVEELTEKLAKKLAEKLAEKLGEKLAEKLAATLKKIPIMNRNGASYGEILKINGLPSTIQRVGPRKGSFSIPKRKRLKTLQFMTKHPQHIIKKRANSWEVLGIPPLMRQKGGNNCNAYLKSVKKVLSQVPDHSLSTSTLLELQTDPRVKRLYDTHFTNNPDHISYPSVRNVITSNILNYDSTTDQVRDSVSDVRKKRKAPLTSVPFSLLQDHEFDRWILQILDSFCAGILHLCSSAFVLA